MTTLVTSPWFQHSPPAPHTPPPPQGRWLLWGWLQERRKVGSYDYACCLSLPRELHVADDGRLLQAPAPEVAALRRGPGYRTRGLRLPSERVTPLPVVGGQALDIEITLERCGAVGRWAAAVAAASLPCACHREALAWLGWCLLEDSICAV